MAASEPGSSESPDERDVVASVDGEGSAQEYVIADITEDGAWLSMQAEDAPDLPSWR